MASFVAKYQITIVVSRIRPVLNATEFEIGYRQARFFFDLADDRGNDTLATFNMALLCQVTDTIYLLDFTLIVSQINLSRKRLDTIQVSSSTIYR